jgi:serine/threonine protein kinase/predicted RNA polymerase sigma factor
MDIEQERFTGKQINGIYHINRRLGKGGMGEAYLATFLIHRNSLVVVKFLLDDVIGQLGQKALQDFRKEADTHAELTHPNIVQFYGHGEYKDRNRSFPYIVMEYAEEGSVAHEVKRRGGLLPEEQSIDFVLQTGDALEYTHSQRVLHRDLKPHNLLLKKEYRSGLYVVKLSDFGITATAHRLHTAAVDITKLEGIGTPEYMPAEQFERNPRIPSDIYSLGVIAFELLSGSKPFTRATPIEYYFAHKQIPPPTLEETRRSKGYQMTKTVGAMEEIVATALQKEPSKRYQTAGDFTEAIKVAQGKVKAEEAKHRRDMDMEAVKQVLLKKQVWGEFVKWELVEKGRELLADKEYQAALSLFYRAASFDPQNTDPWVGINIGTVLNKLEDYWNAVSVFDQTIQIEPNNPIAWNNKGISLINLKQYEEALGALDQAIRLYYTFPIDYFLKGKTLKQLGGGEVHRLLRLTMLLDPIDAHAWNNKGYALNALGRHEEALTAYDEAIRLNPEYREAYYNKGVALEQVGRYEEALLAYKKAQELDPQDTPVKINIERLEERELTVKEIKLLDKPEENRLIEYPDHPEEIFPKLINKNALDIVNRRRMFIGESREIFESITIIPFSYLDPALQIVVQHLVTEQYAQEENKRKYPDINKFTQVVATALQLSFGGFPELAKKGGFTEEITDFDAYFAEQMQKRPDISKSDFAFFILLEDGSVFTTERYYWREARGISYKLRINKLEYNYFKQMNIISQLKVGEQLILNFSPFRKDDSPLNNKIKKIYIGESDHVPNFLVQRYKRPGIGTSTAIGIYFDELLIQADEEKRRADEIKEMSANLLSVATYPITKNAGLRLVYLEKAIRLNPANISAYAGKAETLYEIGRYDEAIAVYDKLIEFDGQNQIKNVFYYIRKGMALGKLGRDEEALAVYDKAIEIEANKVYPEDMNLCYLYKGIALNRLGRDEEALALYDKAMQDSYSGDTFLLPSFKSYTLYKLGRDEEAITIYDDLVAAHSEYELEYYSSKRNNNLESLKKYQEAVKSGDLRTAKSALQELFKK